MLGGKNCRYLNSLEKSFVQFHNILHYKTTFVFWYNKLQGHTLTVLNYPTSCKLVVFSKYFLQSIFFK